MKKVIIRAMARRIHSLEYENQTIRDVAAGYKRSLKILQEKEQEITPDTAKLARLASLMDVIINGNTLVAGHKMSRILKGRLSDVLSEITTWESAKHQSRASQLKHADNSLKESMKEMAEGMADAADLEQSSH